MATETEIMKLWKSLPKTLTEEEAAVQFYRLAESEGKQEGIAALAKELESEDTIESAIKTFGWGNRKAGSAAQKAGVITQKALLREAIYIAKGKIGNKA